MRQAVFLPPFGPLADPVAMIDLAVAVEEAALDGLFLWDHVLRPVHEPAEIADPWIVMAAVATVTERIRLGPMVTPVTRRRPHKLAREVATLDHLSRGRLTLGLGLGVDSGRELSAFGEVVEPRTRGDRLDEGVELLRALWSGEEVDHDGEHFTAAQVRFLPTPVQEPVPLWFAARGDARRPVRRAARHQGLFPIEVDRDGLARMVDLVVAERGDLDGFDIAVVAGGDVSPDEAEALGATWALHGLGPGATPAEVVDLVDRIAPH